MHPGIALMRQDLRAARLEMQAFNDRLGHWPETLLVAMVLLTGIQIGAFYISLRCICCSRETASPTKKAVTR